jgi:ParB family chromosome partitioning protein
MTSSAADAIPPAGPTETTDKPMDKRRALGRGLDSLLPAGPRIVTAAGTAAAPVHNPSALPATTIDEASGEEHGEVLAEVHAAAARRTPDDAVVQIALDQIDPNPYQTRYFFEKELLEELAESIRANGVVQPIMVRPAAEGRYVLVLGERRCRASKLAGKETIPAMVRLISDQQAAEMTVVENLQRQDLNCMEQAAAFAKLSREFEMTQEEIGKRVGVSRESVSNYMRLLRLPGTVMQHLQDGALGFSEARELLRVEDKETVSRIADEAVRKHLSVYQIEDLIDEASLKLGNQQAQKRDGRARWVDPNVRAAQNELQRILGVKVKIRDRKGKGKIVIEYASVDDYERVVGMLRGKG